MAKLDDLLSEWARDAVIDETKLGSEGLRLALLHAKYLKIMALNNRARREIEGRYAKLRNTKGDYYKGHLDQEQLAALGWPPFAFKLTNSGVDQKLSTDPDLVDVLLEKAEMDEIAESCVSILSQIKNMHFTVKADIDWQRFINGG